jgi:hypothetical protein
MAKIEDYLPGGIADPNRGGDALTANINDAASQQEARQEQPRDPATGQFVADATPSTNWETRYKELEKLNSRQAQTLGDQRKLIDEYIVKDPTPNEEPSPQESYQPITVDDLYEDPNAALQRAVDS